jgi:hypothetical protein
MWLSMWSGLVHRREGARGLASTCFEACMPLTQSGKVGLDFDSGPLQQTLSAISQHQGWDGGVLAGIVGTR